MGSAAMIPLMVDKPTFATPIQQATAGLNLQQLAGNVGIQKQVQAENAQKLEAQQRSLDADKALANALSGSMTTAPDGTISVNHDAVGQKLTQAGFGKEYLTYDAQRRADLKNSMDQLKAKLDAQGVAGEQFAGVIDTIPKVDWTKSDPAQIAAYQTGVKNAVAVARSKGLIDDQHAAWALQGSQNPTPEFDQQLRQFGLMGVKHAEQMTQASKALTDAAEIHFKEAQTQETQAKLPGTQAASDEKVTENAASTLAAAARKGPDAFNSALATLPYAVAKKFEGITNPDDILKVGMTPATQATSLNKVAEMAEQKRFHDLTIQMERGRLGAEQAKVAIESKKFIAQFGTPESRAAFTESVKNNPDSYFSLPTEMKPGVAADLVAQGLSVPVQLPGDLKTRSAAAGMTLQAIGRIRNLLADPDVAGAIGPISGRLGNVEQNVGDTFFGESDPRAAKEQQLRTELAYLKFQEGKGLFGGRPATKLIDSLSKVSANPTMSQNLMTGSLNAMENSMKAVGKEAKAYSFGGSQGGASGGTAPAPAPVAKPAPPAVKALLSAGTVAPGVHTLSDGSKWVKNSDGTIVSTQ